MPNGNNRYLSPTEFLERNGGIALQVMNTLLDNLKNICLARLKH